MESSGRLCHEGAMARRNHAAGGFFLIGTIVGIVLAVIVWLVDRRRG
jgi:hypothetical protein